jgi:phosphatidylserine decarboxylase
VDVNESESRGGGPEHRVKTVFAHPVVCGQQTVQQIRKIRLTRPDEFGKRVAQVVPFAEEDAVQAQTRIDEARILYQDAM